MRGVLAPSPSRAAGFEVHVPGEYQNAHRVLLGHWVLLRHWVLLGLNRSLVLYISIHPSTHPSTYLSICLSIYLYIYGFICLSVCLSIHLSISVHHIHIHLLCICIYMYYVHTWTPAWLELGRVPVLQIRDRESLCSYFTCRIRSTLFILPS